MDRAARLDKASEYLSKAVALRRELVDRRGLAESLTNRGVSEQEKGDLESSQIWIEADKLLLVRFIQREKRGERIVVTDTRVSDYREVDGHSVAFEFTSYRDGKVFFKEEYDNVKVNEPIPPELFDASRWATLPAGTP